MSMTSCSKLFHNLEKFGNEFQRFINFILINFIHFNILFSDSNFMLGLDMIILFINNNFYIILILPLHYNNKFQNKFNTNLLIYIALNYLIAFNFLIHFYYIFLYLLYCLLYDLFLLYDLYPLYYLLYYLYYYLYCYLYCFSYYTYYLDCYFYYYHQKSSQVVQFFNILQDYYVVLSLRNFYSHANYFYIFYNDVLVFNLSSIANVIIKVELLVFLLANIALFTL